MVIGAEKYRESKDRAAAMDKNFEHLIKVNTQGRVFVTCQARGVTDPAIIGFYVEILEQAIFSILGDDSTVADFHQVLNEQLAWLEGELDQVRTESAAAPEAGAQAVAATPLSVTAIEHAQKTASGYMPDAKSMPERLKDARADMVHLLDNDCITLKLVTPDQSKAFKRGLLGKDPEKGEEELVTALRNVLHEQVRKFIRKHNGGPWATASMQHDIRMDISRTRTLRSLVILARSLLNEREEWLDKTKHSLTGRFFGGRVKMDNK
jgi:hypothetical protein